MKLCRFRSAESDVRVGLVAEDTTVIDLKEAGVTQMSLLFEDEKLLRGLPELNLEALAHHKLSDIRLCAPVERQEVWAAGVTYLRSKKARMEESDFSATAYDRVYDAVRPEIFFKSLPEKFVATGEAVG